MEAVEEDEEKRRGGSVSRQLEGVESSCLFGVNRACECDSLCTDSHSDWYVLPV